MSYSDSSKFNLKKVMYASGLAASLAFSGTVAAQESSSAEIAESEQARWEAMHERYVNAGDMLTAEVTNGLNPIGEVNNLVLSADGSAIQYILFDTSYPYGHEIAPGFTTFGAVELEGPRVDIDFSETENQAPAQLELTAAEADHRLVSSILASEMYFIDGESFEIVELIIDRETGEIAHYVVSMDSETLYDLDRVTVPADQTDIGEGGTVTSTLASTAVVDLPQEFPEAFLY